MLSYDTSGGAEFVKADLHMHTPDSHDYKDKDIDPDDIVRKLEEEGIKLAAVTDHNTTGFYESLKDSAKDSGVTILPGVEITTGQSGENQIHMTAIFPPEKYSKIDNLLYEIGIDSEGNQQNEIAEKTIPGICEEVRSFDALPILAHIDKEAGAHYELSERENPTRREVFDEERVSALELTSPETRSEFTEFAYLSSSDAHSVSEIGDRYAYLKMSDPSFEGLRTALSDPESRVSLEAEINEHPTIDGLLVERGFLQDRVLQFNGNLNCLIGGKGTGKSSVLEHIRYALDIDPRSDPIKEDYESLIGSTLGANGEVHLLLTVDGGNMYEISRKYGEDPEIKPYSRESGEGEPINIPVEKFRKEFFDAEIHSQRELLGLARNQTDQLNLLDSYFDVEEIKESCNLIKNNIKEKSREINTHKEELSELQEDQHRFDTLREQVNLMKEKGVAEYIEGQEEWEKERTSLTDAVNRVERLKQESESLGLSEILEDVEVKSGPNEELLISVQEEVNYLQQKVRDHEKKVINRVYESLEDIREIKSTWEGENQDREEEHQKLAEEIDEEIGVDINEFFEKQNKLEDLRGVGEEIEEKNDELQEAKEEKEELFAELNEKRRELTKTRREGVSELNGELNDVRVSLKERSNKSEYIDWVNRVLKGSNVYTHDKEDISKTFNPKELAEIIRENNIDKLTEETDVSRTAAENFVEHQDVNERLTELELFKLRDEPVIELNDSGWKELSEMSDGQQCTTLLSIAMIERDVPLIIDQPEDMLDNKFIFSEVVQLVRSIKHDRQIIAATHNANIPVLGDAEQIIVMDSNASNGFYRKCGSIDDNEVKELTQEILEGGPRAFERRDKKYRRDV
jgi:PHP family Zn ribbon phosphoesterase/ABC-type lipoprotein export system ATPase subunit